MHPTRGIGRTIRNLLLISIPSILVTCLLIEIGLRLFVDVSDVAPQNQYNYEYDLLLFKPDQRGVYIKHGGVHGEYRINSAGWNSHREYRQDKAEGEFRVAVIGDSYVEALQVDYDQNFAAMLEQLLGTSVSQPVVYSFGRSGAPLSQYLHIVRYVSATYAPDVYIINLVHNDFEESFRDVAPRSYYLQFRLDENGDIIELPPSPYEPGTASRVFRVMAASALVRYLAYNLDFLVKLTTADDTSTGNAALSDHMYDTALIETLDRYTFQQFVDIARQTDSKVLLIMDAPRCSFYDGTPPQEAPEYTLNRIASDMAQQVGIPFLDLTPCFEADYAIHNKRFDFTGDGHWNAYGHRLVADAVFQELLRLGWLSSAQASKE